MKKVSLLSVKELGLPSGLLLQTIQSSAVAAGCAICSDEGGNPICD